MPDNNSHNPMTHCPRCHGLLHMERLWDTGEACDALHCIMCGTYFDEVITDHKMHGPKKKIHREIHRRN